MIKYHTYISCVTFLIPVHQLSVQIPELAVPSEQSPALTSATLHSNLPLRIQVCFFKVADVHLIFHIAGLATSDLDDRGYKYKVQ